MKCYISCLQVKWLIIQVSSKLQPSKYLIDATTDSKCTGRCDHVKKVSILRSPFRNILATKFNVCVSVWKYKWLHDEFCHSHRNASKWATLHCIIFCRTEGYSCTGNLTGWTKCMFVTKQPKRDTWEISEELKEESDFLWVHVNVLATCFLLRESIVMNTLLTKCS